MTGVRLFRRSRFLVRVAQMTEFGSVLEISYFLGLYGKAHVPPDLLGTRGKHLEVHHNDEMNS